MISQPRVILENEPFPARPYWVPISVCDTSPVVERCRSLCRSGFAPRYTQRMLIDEVNEAGFNGSYATWQYGVTMEFRLWNSGLRNQGTERGSFAFGFSTRWRSPWMALDVPGVLQGIAILPRIIHCNLTFAHRCLL